MRCWSLSMQVASGVVGLSLFAGCSGAPPRLVQPSLDASGASAAAIKQYDKNSDAALDDAELKACPGLLKAKAKYDKNNDGKISADEIAARIGEWQTAGTGLMTFSLGFTLDGKPLEGAEVKLVPEAWLGSEIKGGSGKTDSAGNAGISLGSSDLRPEEANLKGMRLGVYKIQVTHPTAKIPAKFNTASELGIEIGPEGTSQPPIPLTSK